MDSELTRQSTKILVPHDFYCPISGDLMIDPVSDPEGNTYERTQIITWLERNSTSPITRSPLIESNLIPNVALRKAIDEIRDRLQSDQLKIDSSIAELEVKEYIDKLEDIKIETYYDDEKLFLKVITPMVETRAPVDIVLCIDISGSMGVEAPIRGQSGEKINTNVSVLSLTVTASNTILDSLNDKDNISIVVYTDTARSLVENISCTPENVSLIKAQLNELKPENTTNIWDGLYKSLEILRTTSPEQRQKNIFLLTDGIPNIEPPRGHIPMLERYFKQNNFKCMITTFGFGYNLNSALLNDISTITGGDGFSYIPDSGLLGNIFIHGISNFLTTAICNPSVNIKLNNGYRFKDGRNELNFNITSLKYGQTKNYVFDLDISGREVTSLHTPHTLNIANTILNINGKIINVEQTPFPDVNYKLEQIYRYKVIDCITKCLDLQKYRENEKVINTINPLIEEMKSNMTLLANKYIQDIVTDLEGQVREALNMTEQGSRDDWFSRWGKHYLRSLRGAYMNELCNNFKDMGISNFGGELFINIRDSVSDIFDGQPPPKQDIKPVNSYGYVRGGGSMRGGGSIPISAPTSQSYNNASGPCCAENSYVTMSNNNKKQIKNIKKGDIVISYDKNMNKTTSVIECVIKTECIDLCPMIQINKLHITPYHPIINNEEWTFPINIGRQVYVDTDYIYSIITDNRNSIVVDNYIFATFGHGLKGNIIEHNYYGTENVINDMKKFNTYNDGYVMLEKNMIKRDDNMLVNKISM